MLEIQAVTKRFRAGNYGVRDVSLSLSHGVLGLLGPNGAGKTTLMQMIATITRPTSGRVLFRGDDVTVHPNALRERLGYLPQDFGVYDNLTAYEFLSYFAPEERVRFRNVLADLGLGKLVILSTHIVSDVESIATQIAILRGGSLVAMATPEELLQLAGGSVWQMVVSSDAFDDLRRTARVSAAQRKSDGVHVRVVSTVAPSPHASAAEPTLEDAFLHAMEAA